MCMLTTSFESPDALKTFVSKSSVEQFKTALPGFSFSEIAESFVLLQTQLIIEPKDKLNCLMQFVDSPGNLDLLGKHFAVPHFLSFLDFLNQHPAYQDRLNFILVGLHPIVFSQALHFMQNSHFSYLKLEGLLEPLQYHLTQFAHEGEDLWQHINQKVEQLIQNFSFIKPEELTPDGLEALLLQIDSFKGQLLDYLERISAALSIAWHTDRIDLIEKLSSIHETLQHQFTHVIGHPSFDHFSSTGLYSTLEQMFFKIFDATLKDEDAALEGLTRLSIWHLKDYWELGLLPFIPSTQELDLDPQRYPEEERTAHHQHLLFLVQQQLERLHIGTVGRLKKAYLFSKPLLEAYIEQHRHLLLKRSNA